MKIIFKNITNVTHIHLNNAVGNDVYRPAMTGVFVDLRNKKLVCTDAHVLIMYPIEMHYEENYMNDTNTDFTKEDCKIVPTELFNKNKYMGNWKNYLFPFTYHLDEDYARVYAGPEEVFKCRYIKADYPDYEKVVLSPKDKKPLDEIGLNIGIISRLAKAVPRGTKVFKFVFHAQNRAVNLLEQNEYENVIEALIMPAMLS